MGWVGMFAVSSVTSNKLTLPNIAPYFKNPTRSQPAYFLKLFQVCGPGIFVNNEAKLFI